MLIRESSFGTETNARQRHGTRLGCSPSTVTRRHVYSVSMQGSPGVVVLRSQTQIDPEELSPPPIHLSTRFMSSGMSLLKSALLSSGNTAS